MKKARGNRLYDIAMRPKMREEEGSDPDTATAGVAVVPPQPPPISTYLDPDAEHGRPRVVIMLSEDGERIENLLYTRMSYVSAVSNLAIMSDIHTQELLSHIAKMEREHEGMLAEIKFLRQKLVESAPPPRDAVQPAPMMARESGD